MEYDKATWDASLARRIGRRSEMRVAVDLMQVGDCIRIPHECRYGSTGYCSMSSLMVHLRQAAKKMPSSPSYEWYHAKDEKGVAIVRRVA